MVDWKKDIKLSDLLARDREVADVADEAAPFAEHSEPDATEVEPVEAAATEETPFWKRELSFRRQKDESDADPDFDVPTDEPEKRPFFKRDLSFRRTTDDAAHETDVDWNADGPEETTPFWKREFSFGRAKDDDVPVQDDADDDTDFAEPAAESAETTPFWKRDLSFGRRKTGAPDDSSDHEELSWADVEPVAGASETPVEPEEQAHAEPEPLVESVFESDETPATAEAPFWKRDLSFRRTTDDAAHKTDFDSSVEEPEERTPFWKRELGFGRAKDDAVPAQDDFEDDTDVAEPAAETEEATPFWKRDLSFGRRKTDAPDGSSDNEEPSWDDVEPVAGVPEVPVEPEQPAHVEPEPVVASVPESEQTSATDEAPFWKREIKFRRRRGDEVQEPGPTEPEPELVGEESEPIAAAAFALDTEDKKPFWKRQLNFGRTKEDSADSGFEFGHEQKERKSFFKREFRFRQAKDPDFDAPSRRSFFKRDLGFRRRKADSGAGRDVVAAPTETEKRPFFKRELSFRRNKGTGRESGGVRSGRGGRTKQLVGLKVGASQIAAAQVVNNGSPMLVQLARQPIEQGIVVGGELRDPDALAEALREFFAAHKLPSRNVRLGIGNNRIGVRSFEISSVHDPKQLENAIRFRAQEALPIPLDEAVLDYHVLEEATSPTGVRTYRVLLVVAYRELIDRYVAACRGAGLRLVGIDLEAFALLRALSPPPSEGFPEDTALVAVSIGHDRSTFAVSNGTVCEFTRVLDWGGSSLNTAIARALDMTPSQAEPVKRTLSLREGEEGAGAGPQGSEHTIMAEEAVRLELQSFARELVSSLHFYQNQPGSLAIGSITLTGGTAHLPGLAAELQRLIGVKVRVGDPLRRLKTGKRVEAPDQVGSMAIAIGLGIED